MEFQNIQCKVSIVGAGHERAHQRRQSGPRPWRLDGRLASVLVSAGRAEIGSTRHRFCFLNAFYQPHLCDRTV